MPVGLPVMCSHDVVYNGLCALCGEEVQQQQAHQTAASTRAFSSTASAAAAALYDAFHPLHEQELPHIDDLAVSTRHRHRATASSSSSSSASTSASSSLSSSSSAASHLPLVVGSRLLHLTASAFHRQLADNMRRLHAARKLVLVLDIDHTLLHTTDDPTLLHSLPQPLPDSIHSFTLPYSAPPQPPSSSSSLLPPPPPQRLFLRLRPHLPSFLSSLSSLYELHIYTMGSRAYADVVLPIIDPAARLVKGRVVTRTESEGAVKVLERMCAVDASMVAIVDDRVDVWAGERRGSLLRALEYRYFTGREVYDREDGRERERGRDRAGADTQQGRQPDSDKHRAATGTRAQHSSSSSRGQHLHTAAVVQPVASSAAAPSQDEMQAADDEPVLVHRGQATATTTAGTGGMEKSRRDVIIIDGEPASQQKRQSEPAAAAADDNDDVVELAAGKRGSKQQSATGQQQQQQQQQQQRGRIPRKQPPAVPLWAEEEGRAVPPTAPAEAAETAQTAAASPSSSPSPQASSPSPPTSELAASPSSLPPPSPASSAAATAKGSPAASTAVSPSQRPPPILPAQLDPAKADNILLSLLSVLRALHFLFYAQFSPPSSLSFSLPLPAASSLPAVLSDIKRSVLRGCHLVFSGVFPAGVKVKDSEAGKLAEAFGAVVSERLGKGGEGEGGEEDGSRGGLVTHVVAAKDGSDKVKQAMRLRRQRDGGSGSSSSSSTPLSPPFVVHLAWLHHSVHHFQRADEAAFPLSLQPQSAAAAGEAPAGKEKEPSRASVEPALIQHTQQPVTAEQLIDAVQSLRRSEQQQQPHTAAPLSAEQLVQAEPAAVSSSSSAGEPQDGGAVRIRRKRRPQPAAITDGAVADDQADSVKQRRTEKTDAMAVVEEEPTAPSLAAVALMADNGAAVGDGDNAEIMSNGDADEQRAAEHNT